MSVVNKMLQDLETRKKREGISANYVPKAKEPGRLKPWMLLASVCAIATAIIVSQGGQFSSPSARVYTQQLPPSTLGPLQSAAPISAMTPTTPELLSKSAEPVAFSTPIAAKMDLASSDDSPQRTVESKIAANTPEQLRDQSEHIPSRSTTEEPSFAIVSSEAAETALVKRGASTHTENRAGTAEITALNDLRAEGEFSVAPSNGSRGRISSLREQARIALNNNDIRAALHALDSLIASYPDDVRSRKQLASLLFSRSEFTRAQQVLAEGLLIAPADNAMRVMLARVAFKTGHYQDAHNTLAAHPFPQLADVELISFRAALAERLSQYSNANNDYKLLVSREPNQAKWWLGLGVSQDKLKQSAQAIASYQQAKNLNQLGQQVNDFVEQRIVALVGQG